jgi:hypothetical protein
MEQCPVEAAAGSLGGGDSVGDQVGAHVIAFSSSTDPAATVTDDRDGPGTGTPALIIVPDPAAQRLPVDAQVIGDRRDRRPAESGTTRPRRP